jgi:hypothetical protein
MMPLTGYGTIFRCLRRGRSFFLQVALNVEENKQVNASED